MGLRKKKHPKSMGGQRRILITAYDPKSPVSEQYRTIRTNIQYASVDREIKVILVTSAGPGEGKSTTAANLAVAFAQAGNKVLMVDGDLRKPTAHFTFNVPNTFGLTSVLTKQTTLDDAYRKTDVQNLFILSSGPIPPNPSEVLGSESMDALLEEAKSMFDIIIFDTPPVLVVADPQILANKADGSILVTSSGKTDIEGAKKAKEILANAKAKLLGAVLNNKSIKSTDYYYYYNNK
ncbi:CpsD/CapB family tyrosine-protein kinase [Bacillus massilinigeriensis]|uniref:CpsD/CapB family tyrosine-protein kinase n=1 Tax=Bacillus mediterraneensis TaxID=1805474 RepID=UPI0008F82FBA|nr:CpsD/CapB family tyrosine-protein kinase [Bacillus mediterraneensis]